MKLLSTRARAQLWKLQEGVCTAAKERERLWRALTFGRTVLMPSANRELWMEFACADQEYRYAVAKLHAFCERDGRTSAAESA